MARLMTFGAEEGKGRGMGDVFTVVGTTSFVQDINDNLAIQPRTGDYYYSINGRSQDNYLQYPIPYTSTELYIGFAAYAVFTSSSSLGYSVYFSGIDAGIRLEANTGNIYWVRSGVTVGTPAPLALNKWNYIECYIKPVAAGTGAVTIKVNGVTVYTYAATQTIASTFVNFGNIRFCATSSSTGQSYYGPVYYDDIVVNDISGSNNLSWPGQVRLFPMRIKGPGDHAALSRGGADLGFNQSQVREIFSAASWVEGINTDDYDLYTIDAPTLPAGSTISNIVLELHARAPAGGKSIKPILKSNATASDGPATTLGTSWQVIQQAWALDPQDSAAWTAADLATLQVGVKIG